MTTAVLPESPCSVPSQEPSAASRVWLPLAVGICFLYGLVLVALIHTTADGSWYWYADALRQGQHLYRDLHLPLQPVYPIELLAAQMLFGSSWLGQQSVGVINLVFFLWALTFVVQATPFVPWQRAALLGGGFITCMAFIMMRFDDFHVVATSFQLACAGVLLRLSCASVARRHLAYGILGVLCGACVLVRLNDGVLLLCAVTFAALGAARSTRERLTALLLIAAFAAFLVLCTLAALREKPGDWWFYSVHTAATIKGGAGHLLAYPFRLPGGTLRELTRDWRTEALTAYAVLVAGAAWLTSGTRLAQRTRICIWIATLVAALPLARNIAYGNAARVLVALTVCLLYLCAVGLLYRLAHVLRGTPAPTWHPAELTLLIPLAQLVSVSLSAARWYPNTNPAAALFVVIAPGALPSIFRARRVRAVFFCLLALLTLSGGIDKVRNPFDWFNYRARGLDAPRTWYRHPVFGPMLIDPQHLALMQPVCSAVSQNAGQGRELLSLPFTYANYFCAVRPWRGYVQTFYDLSDRTTIETLQQRLLTGPPAWIVYQRQMDVLRENEKAFGGGGPLPHRALDSLVMHQLQSGQWQAERLVSPVGDTSTWLLIHTHPLSR